MSILYTAFVAALVVGGGASALIDAYTEFGEGPAFISREWTWSDGTSTTTFTAYGPSEQVNALDPENGLLECPDCQLMSSVQFGPENEADLNEVADQAGDGR
jgi:hypothetical protein